MTALKTILVVVWLVVFQYKDKSKVMSMKVGYSLHKPSIPFTTTLNRLKNTLLNTALNRQIRDMIKSFTKNH